MLDAMAHQELAARSNDALLHALDNTRMASCLLLLRPHKVSSSIGSMVMQKLCSLSMDVGMLSRFLLTGQRAYSFESARVKVGM